MLIQALRAAMHTQIEVLIEETAVIITSGIGLLLRMEQRLCAA